MNFTQFLLSILNEYGLTILTAFIAWLIRKFEKPKAVKAARQSAFDQFLDERPDLTDAINKHLAKKATKRK